jgi:DNA polymerase III subunit beta
MRLLIERSQLFTALSHVASVVERRTTIPILSNVLLRATEEGAISLKGTDLEREVLESVHGDVTQAGAVTIQAHLLHDIVRKLADGAQITLESAGGGERMQLLCGHARFQLPALAADEFPDIGAGEMPHEFELPAHELKRLIEKARFAISTEETRYYLNGIYLHTAQSSGKTVLRAVATDGHRLAQIETDAPAGATGMPGVIVPRKTVNEVHKLLEGVDGDVKVCLSNTRIQFSVPKNAYKVVMTSKLIDGTFPDYQRVIPQANNKVMMVGNAEFAAAVDRVATVSSERGRAVKLAIEQGKLVLSVTNPDGGNATEEIPVDYDADKLEIGFNARYLLDITAQLESSTVKLFLSDAGSPTTVRDESDEGALYVLMPMRV